MTGDGGDGMIVRWARSWAKFQKGHSNSCFVKGTTEPQGVSQWKFSGIGIERDCI